MHHNLTLVNFGRDTLSQMSFIPQKSLTACSKMRRITIIFSEGQQKTTSLSQLIQKLHFLSIRDRSKRCRSFWKKKTTVTLLALWVNKQSAVNQEQTAASALRGINGQDKLKYLLSFSYNRLTGNSHSLLLTSLILALVQLSTKSQQGGAKLGIK